MEHMPEPHDYTASRYHGTADKPHNPRQRPIFSDVVYLSLTIKTHVYAHKSLRIHLGNFHTTHREEREDNMAKIAKKVTKTKSIVKTKAKAKAAPKAAVKAAVKTARKPAAKAKAKVATKRAGAARRKTTAKAGRTTKASGKSSARGSSVRRKAA